MKIISKAIKQRIRKVNELLLNSEKNCRHFREFRNNLKQNQSFQGESITDDTGLTVNLPSKKGLVISDSRSVNTASQTIIPHKSLDTKRFQVHRILKPTCGVDALGNH